MLEGEGLFNDATALVAWAGMRGADSLVIALAIPFVTRAGTPFPAHDLIVFITFGVIFATLVVQGLTLAPAIKLLKVPRDDFDLEDEAVARAEEARAALECLDQIAGKDNVPPHIIRRLRDRYTIRLKRWSARRDGRGTDQTDTACTTGEGWDTTAAEYARVREDLLCAERDALTKLRNRERVSDEVLRRLQRELDLEMMLLDSSDADNAMSAESPFEMDDGGE